MKPARKYGIDFVLRGVIDLLQGIEIFILRYLIQLFKEAKVSAASVLNCSSGVTTSYTRNDTVDTICNGFI